MPNNRLMLVRDLSLDLMNFRTIHQANEGRAVQAMVSINPGYFWGLMESLIDSGYLPTENILVLQTGTNPPLLTVKEGNRRIAAMKLILGYLPRNTVDLPENIKNRIDDLPSNWISNNENVPCTIYTEAETSIVDRIVSLAHGKGEKAGRAQWTAIARARHSRDVNKASQVSLDLLEKYLDQGRNLSPEQAERWAGDYPLTVLDEAMKKISTRFGVNNAPELAKQYPAVPYRDALDHILLDIGLHIIRFETLRQPNANFPESYGVPPLPTSGNTGGNTSQQDNASTDSGSTGGSAGGNVGSLNQGTSQPSGSPGTQSTSNGTQGGSGGTSATGKKIGAVPLNDPKAVKRALKILKPMGGNRNKVVTLRDEAFRLNLGENPFAFCFLLRSMFEISAKAYCDDHQASGGPTAMQPNGADKRLGDLLKEITVHLTRNNNDKEMVRKLHGALTELHKKEGILSVTSMNQLVHNPSFSVTPCDICAMFGNIFPLLKAMSG